MALSSGQSFRGDPLRSSDRPSRSSQSQDHAAPQEDLCGEAGNDLDDADVRLSEARDTDWATASLSQLIDNLVHAHHAFLYRKLPRIEQFMCQVAVVHGLKHCQLEQLAQVFVKLESELAASVQQQEQVVIPIIKQSERAGAATPQVAAVDSDQVRQAVAVMREEHRNVNQALSRMRGITQGYIAPSRACSTYRALLARLAELETDLHRYIQRIDRFLVPKVADLVSPDSTVSEQDL